MLVQYCSDLHLEFPINRKYLQENPIIPQGEILLLGGDIVPFSEMHKRGEFFDFVADHFEQTYWVPGNHEYYRSDVVPRAGMICERIRSNVSLVNNYAVVHKNVRLILSTLWSKIGPQHESEILKSMADFWLINNNGKVLTIEDYNALHERCRSFLVTELEKKSDQTTIVVSHHIPTFLNYPEKFKHSPINEAFAVELFEEIERSNIAYWLFGHTHEVVPDFAIGKTILTTNQLGYVEYAEHLKFDHQKIIALEARGKSPQLT